MKNIGVAFIVLLCCLSLVSCTENITKYKNNENDNYMTEEFNTGGNRNITDSYVEKVSFSWLLGPEKLIFDIQNKNGETVELPYYNIQVSESGNQISGIILNCKLKSENVPDFAKSKVIESFEIKSQENNVFFNIKLKESSSKLRIDGYGESGKLIISLAQTSPVEAE